MTQIETVKFALRPATTMLTLSALSFCLIVPGLRAWAYPREASAVIPVGTIKATVQELGLGAKVKLSTLSRAKPYYGYITRIDEDSFEVTDVAHWQANIFDYSVIHKIVGKHLPNSTYPIENRVLRALLSTASRFGVGP